MLWLYEFGAALSAAPRMPYLANTAFPATGHPVPIRALRHPWRRLPLYQRGTN